VSGRRVGDDPVDILTAAARDVRAVAPAVAIELYRRAQSLLADDDELRELAIEVECLEPLARAGDIDAARRHAAALLDRYRGEPQRQQIHTGLAAVLATAGDLTSSNVHYREASVADEEGHDLVAHCHATSQRVLLGDDPNEIALTLQRTLDATSDAHASCIAHQGLALTAGAQCRYDLAADHALESLRRFDPRTMPRAGFLIPDIWVASFDAYQDRFDNASVWFERVAYEAERRREPATLVHTSAALGTVSLFNGKWDDAEREFTEVLGLAEESGANAHLVSARAGLALMSFGRGNDAAGSAHLAAGHEAMNQGSHLFGVDLLVWVTATQAMNAGDHGAGFEQLWSLWQLTSPMRGLTQFRSVAPALVLAALATDHVDAGRVVVAELERIAETCRVPSVVAAAQRCRALLHRDPDGLAAAGRLLSTTPWRLDYSHTCLEAATLTAESGRDDRVTEHTRAAAVELREAGASSTLDRVRRQFGPTADGPEPDLYRQVPWESLSRRELEVVDLVREGLSNPDIAQRLFISRRTVESHVANVIRKLGAANRTHVASLSSRRSAQG
jgi:DNA-binding CsgD family transcriptional regulator